MKVQLKTITPNIETSIVEIARVSSSRKNKSTKPEKLITYLIENKHFSPFEHGFMTLEIETSKAIAIQLLRHRSFTFQELSQRYQNVTTAFKEDMYEPIELRKQCNNNRQSSTEVFDPVMNSGMKASQEIELHNNRTKGLYSALIAKGVARECARFVLPTCSKTIMYMSGSVRSWIHFLSIRDDSHAQKEMQLVANECKSIFIEQLPIISKALEYSV